MEILSFKGWCCPHCGEVARIEELVVNYYSGGLDSSYAGESYNLQTG